MINYSLPSERPFGLTPKKAKKCGNNLRRWEELLLSNSGAPETHHEMGELLLPRETLNGENYGPISLVKK